MITLPIVRYCFATFPESFDTAAAADKLDLELEGRKCVVQVARPKAQTRDQQKKAHRSNKAGGDESKSRAKGEGSAEEGKKRRRRPRQRKKSEAKGEHESKDRSQQQRKPRSLHWTVCAPQNTTVGEYV